MTNVRRALVPVCMALFLMLLASLLHADDKVSWAGTWKLNLEKSDFGKDPKPKEIIVKIDDTKYSVTGTNDKGQPINVEWEGAADGKPRKETGPQGGMSVTLKEINDHVVEGTKISADGKQTETWTSTLSKDGKVMTEKWRIKGPKGESKLRLLYDKQ